MRTFAVLIGALVVFAAAPAVSAALLSEVEFPTPKITLYATPSTVTAGSPATLTWTTLNTRTCSASGAWSGAKPRNGSSTVRPTRTSTYILTCVGRGGTTQSSITISVGTAPQPPTPLPPLATSTPTSTPPTPQPPATTTPPTPPTTEPPTGTPTTTPPTPAPAACPAFSVPTCSAGSYPTPGNVDAKGCFTSMRCTGSVAPSAPQFVPAPAGSSYAAGSDYAGTRKAGAYAAVVYPTPTAALTYGLTLDKRSVWWVTGTVGLSPIVVTATSTPTPNPVEEPIDNGVGDANIRGATYGGSIKVTITATADKIDPSDKESEVLYTTTVSPTSGAQTFKLPLGVWALRPNLKLVVSTEKSAADTLKYGAVVDGLGVYTFGARPDQGIVNNDPEWKSADQQEKQLAALAQFPVSWIHDSIRTTGASWPQAPLLKRVQDQGKKIQLVVGPMDEDYTEGEAARVRLPAEHAAWGYALPFSKINLDLYEKRLRANLTSYKNAGVDVKAVEVGNELDLVAFNGDIPLNRGVTDADYQLFAETYATFLERTVTIVKRPEFYPNAKIILGSPALDWSPAVGKMEPGRMYAPLKNLNGKNYLALVDGIGVHYYPADHEDGAASVARTKAFLTTIGATDRPLWVSEWGFFNNRFPNSAGKDRYRAFVDLYDKILRADVKVVFMTNFALDEFNFPFHLVDSSYQKLPEARFFDHYPSPVPSTVALEPLVVPPVACIWCPLSDWSEELWLDLRDWVLTIFNT